jgi:hypothetical protein
MSDRLPFGVPCAKPADCFRGDYVIEALLPEWGPEPEEREVADPKVPSGKPWLFVRVLHATPTGDEWVWKRMS